MRLLRIRLFHACVCGGLMVIYWLCGEPQFDRKQESGINSLQCENFQGPIDVEFSKPVFFQQPTKLNFSNMYFFNTIKNEF